MQFKSMVENIIEMIENEIVLNHSILNIMKNKEF